jgi:hypothetical protein
MQSSSLFIVVPLPSRPPHSQQKQQRDTNGPHAGYGERHHSGGRFFSIEAHHISSST